MYCCSSGVYCLDSGAERDGTFGSVFDLDFFLPGVALEVDHFEMGPQNLSPSGVTVEGSKLDKLGFDTLFSVTSPFEVC